jgi:hypothetical protein
LAATTKNGAIVCYSDGYARVQACAGVCNATNSAIVDNVQQVCTDAADTQTRYIHP